VQKRWFGRALGAPLLVLAAATFTALTSLPAGAAEQTVCHDGTLARQRTEVDTDMTVPQFDPALGTLLEVSVPQQGVHLDTDAVFENVAQTSVLFEEHMSYQVTFTSPGGLSSPPVVTGTIERIPSQTLAAFDGTLDFAGVSAVAQPSTSRDANAAPVSTTDPATLAAFTGSGSMPFHVATEIGETFTGGGGNIQFQINTFVAGSVRVCYRYAPAAPPTTAPPTTTPPTTAPTPVEVSAAPPVVAAPPLPARPAFTG